MMKYTSNVKKIGKLKGATDKGERIYWYGQLYRKKKNGIYEQLC